MGRQDHRTQRRRHKEALQSSSVDPDVSKLVIPVARDLYSAAERLRRAGLPPEGHAFVSGIQADVIAFGQWLRDHGYTDER